jgi:hypothetical protein
MLRGEREGNEGPQGMAHQDWPLQTQVIDQRQDILAMVVKGISRRGFI